MAGEVGHVVYGARVLAYLNEKVQKPDYWSGTLFPDIRHLGVVSRHRAHPDGVTLSTLVGENDWLTGLRVHAWIDATREDFLQKRHIKEDLPWHPFVPHALKLVEDEFLYDKFDDWNLIQRVLGKVHEEELDFVPSREAVTKWHSILKDYLAGPPTDATRIGLATGIGLSITSGQEINTVVEMLRAHRETQVLLDDFLVHFEKLLS